MTAAERSRRRSEVFGYAPLMLGAAELEPEAAREGITLGPLKGYAVRYALKLPPEKMPDPGDGRKLGLLVLSLTDGCVIFEPTLLLRGAGEAPWTGPESLLAELVIDRKPSREAQFPVPPRKTAPKGAR